LIIIGIIIIIVLVHFLIIRPLMRRSRPQVFEPRRDFYNDERDYYGPGGPGGIGNIGRVGTFAGGLAAGALLTYLFEQGRIGFDQYQDWQNLEDHEIIRELMDQNILQQDEIERLHEEFGGGHDGRDQFGNADDINYDHNDQQGDEDFGSWDNSDDNWV
jgi:hypothetical protein